MFVVLEEFNVDEPSRPVGFSLGMPPAKRPASGNPLGVDWFELAVFEVLLFVPKLLLFEFETLFTFPEIIGALLSTVTVFFNFVPLRIEFRRAPLSSEPFGMEKAGGGGAAGAIGGGGGGPGILDFVVCVYPD